MSDYTTSLRSLRTGAALLLLAGLGACGGEGESYRTMDDELRSLGLDESFESTDFEGWEILGNVSVHTKSYGTFPSAGKYQGLISTQGGVGADELSNFLATSEEDLANFGNVSNGSGIRTIVEVRPGDVLQFDWNFMTNETSFDSDPSSYNDFAFFVSGIPFVIADTGVDLHPSSTPFHTESGYQTFTHVFEEGGEVVLGVGAVNVIDSGFDSAVLLDNIRIMREGVVDFDQSSEGEPLPAGTVVEDQFLGDGVHLTCESDNKHRPDKCLIFDSSDPWTHKQLGTPSADYGGPGLGWGGRAGLPGANDKALGNLLILAYGDEDANDDGLVDAPYSDWRRGTMHFEFDSPHFIEGLTLVGIDADPERGVEIHVESEEGAFDFESKAWGTNSVQDVLMDINHVTSIDLRFNGQGALGSIVYKPTNTEAAAE